jgi:cyclophilin family peptidyl-prolyl cis-trans isomerase
MTRTRTTRLVALLAIPLLIAACSSSAAVPSPAKPSSAVSDVKAPTPSPTPANTGPADQLGCPTSQPAALPAGQTRTVTLQTAKGAIAITIHADWSPIAAGNFVALASCGYYDGVVFHRVVPGFVIQGGDGQYGRSPNLNVSMMGRGGPSYTIKDEPVTQQYHRGIVAMARTSLPNSVNSQFFIVLDDGAKPALASANTYQIIGEVTSGMDAVDKIAAAADQEIPTNPVVMTKVSVANP